jgi:hypothetical protein
MLQAYLVFPIFALVYLIFAKEKSAKRFRYMKKYNFMKKYKTNVDMEVLDSE